MRGIDSCDRAGIGQAEGEGRTPRDETLLLGMILAREQIEERAERLGRNAHERQMEAAG